MAGFSLSKIKSANKSGPTRLTVRPLMVRTAGGDRTRDNLVSQASALSAELQRYAARKIDKFESIVSRFSFAVDKNSANLFLVRRVLFPKSNSEKPRQQWRGFRIPSPCHTPPINYPHGLRTRTRPQPCTR